MDKNLKLEVLHAGQLTSQVITEIRRLCNRAYKADLEPLFRTFNDTTHVLGWWGSAIVSHAMWVTRWLQPSNQPPFRCQASGVKVNCGNVSLARVEVPPNTVYTPSARPTPALAPGASVVQPGWAGGYAARF